MNIFDSLEIKLKSEAFESRRIALEVEYATYLVRAGYVERAREILNRHQRATSFGENPASSLMLMLLSGLIEFYSKRSIDFAVDKLNRASKLAQMIGDRKPISRLNAWLAHMYFNACRYDRMAHCLDVAFEYLDEENHDARIRACLTVGDALCCSGRFDLASSWYSSARREAEVIGDQMATAAIMHNRSGMALAHCRVGEAFDRPVPDLARRLLREVSSAEQYERYSRFESVLLPYSVWAGRVALFEGRAEVAENLLEAGLSNNLGEIWLAMEQAVRVDLGYARLVSGRLSRNEFDFSKIEEKSLDCLYSDDNAVAYKMLGEIAVFDGRQEDANRFMNRARESLQAFVDEVGKIESSVRSIHEKWSTRIGIGL